MPVRVTLDVNLFNGPKLTTEELQRRLALLVVELQKTLSELAKAIKDLETP